MNPQSTEGNGINGSVNQLAFRASLGGDLYTESVSIHPKVSGPTGYPTSSFASGSNFTLSEIEFNTNREWIFYDSPPVGIKNRNTDKIKRQDLILPEGDTLSNQRSIQQKSYTTQDYTNNLNLLEVAFSPQNEINDDIINQIGFFNIGDYIGDPRLVSSSADTYPSLIELSKQYFEKYTSSYDVYDYIRLIKFFDNSLFKMIKDYVPVRTGLASGIVVKQHILERQKYPTPQAEWTRPEYTGSIGSIPMVDDEYNRYYQASTDFESIPIETISGSDGGTFLPGYVTQSWDGINVTPLGDVPFTQDNKEEFIDGEFSGSVITVTDGELNTECDTFKRADTTDIQYYISSSTPIDTYQFLNSVTPFPTNNGAGYTMMDSATNDGLKIYLNWKYDRLEYEPFPSFVQNYYWKVVGFAIKIPESANAVEVEDYITSLKTLKLVDVNFVGTDFPLSSLQSDASWPTSGVTYTQDVINGEDPILKPISFRKLSAYSGVGNFIYVETEPSDMEFELGFASLGSLPGDLYGFEVLSKDLTNVVFEPFVPDTFQNSDCNPLYGNAVKDTLSTVYYDVDYANNPNVAINFDAIMNGTATKAEIQDYNYYTRRSTIPRYEGSKNTSNDYNVLDGAIDTTQALFGYFNWVGGTSPEWGNGLEDRSVANLRFLLDVNGKIIKPIADSQGINQSIVESNFTEGKIATLAFDDESGSSAAFSNLLGDHTIFKSGKDITPIIYSQTESISSTSGGGYTSSINFVQGDQQQDSTIPDYRLTSNASNPTIVINGTYVEYDNVSIEGTDADVYNPAPNVWGYKVVNSSPSSNNVTLNLNAALEVNSAVNKQVTVQFYKSTNNGATFSAVGSSVTKDFNNVTYGGLYISYSTTTANMNDIFALKVLGITGDPGPFSINNNSQFIATQTPPPNLGAATSPYWTSVGNVLTLTGLNSFYGQKQEDIANTGFFGIVNDFVLQPVDGTTGTLGDEIRFEGTETQTYTVTAVSNTNPITITVDRDITATNLNWFLVRRYVDNPANIILEVDKPAGGTSPGILKPQYLSKDAENNIDTILEGLRRDSLI